jgi:hypothetical protein
MGSLFPGARAIPQLPANMPLARVFNDSQKMLATGAAPPQSAPPQPLGQNAIPGADLRRRAMQTNLLSQYGNRGTLASGAVGVPYAGATLGGGR